MYRLLMLLMAGALFTACGEDYCGDGCDRAIELCGAEAFSKAECVDACEDFSDSVQEAAAACIESANTCEQAGACVPDGFE